MDGKPLILALETATQCGSVALTRGTFEDGELLAECSSKPDRSHTRRLLGSIQWVLETASLSWEQLDGIAVSLGPGSFTGLRIGLAAAKGMAMSAGLPLLGVSTLDSLAYVCLGEKRLICSVLDARKQEVYAAFHRMTAEGIAHRVGGYMAIKPEELVRSIKEPVAFVGPGVELYGSLFAQCKDSRVYPAALGSPRASHAGFLGGLQLCQGRTMDPANAAPMYVRASEAEVNLKKKHKEDLPATDSTDAIPQPVAMQHDGISR